MEEVVKTLSLQFYTPLLSLTVAIICMCLGFKKKKHFKHLRYFPIYAGLYSSLYILLYLLMILECNDIIGKIIINNYDNLFTLTEFIIYISFFKNFFNQQSYKTALRFLFLIYLIIFIYLTANANIKYHTLPQSIKSTIYTIESICLIIPCIIYFFYLFQGSPTLKLLNESTFWIVMGVFFMLFCTLPYSIAENYFLRNDWVLGRQLYSLFNIFYTLNFLMIIRAYLCKVKNTTS